MSSPIHNVPTDSGGHNFLSPSGWDKWSACPLSAHLEAGQPDQTSPAAAWGTDAHTLLEFWGVNNRQPIQEDFPDMEDMQTKLYVAHIAYDYVQARARELHPAVLRWEQKVSPARFTGIEEMAEGTADVILASPTTLEIIDLKGGQGVIVEPDHKQLWIYALGALADYWVEGKPPPFENVRITIVQPRAKHPDGPIRFIDMPVQDLLAFVPVLQQAIVNATADNPTGNPGEIQCRWCRGRPVCPAIAEHSMAALGISFDNLSTTGDTIARYSPAGFTLEQLVQIDEAAPLITGWLKTVNDHLFELLLDRQEVPGRKLVQQPGKETWSVSPEEVADTLSKGKNRLTKRLLFEQKLRSLTSMKKEGLTKLQLERVQALRAKGPSKLVMVDAADKRPNAMPRIEFTPIEPEAQTEMDFLA